MECMCVCLLDLRKVSSSAERADLGGSVAARDVGRPAAGEGGALEACVEGLGFEGALETSVSGSQSSKCLRAPGSASAMPLGESGTLWAAQKLRKPRFCTFKLLDMPAANAFASIPVTLCLGPRRAGRPVLAIIAAALGSQKSMCNLKRRPRYMYGAVSRKAIGIRAMHAGGNTADHLFCAHREVQAFSGI